MSKCKNCKRLEQLEGEWCWCPVYIDSFDLDEEWECEHFKCMTNADSVHRMNEEELSQFLCGVSRGCDSCIGYDLCVLGGGEANGMLKWLKQEVKNE